MPTYRFQNIETGEISEVLLKISELDQYREDHPELRTIISAPGIVSGSGGMKTDSGWKENMSRIAEAHPGTPLADRFGKKTTKEIKTRDALKKHGVIE